MKRFTLAKLRLFRAQALWPLLLLSALATLPGCVSSTLQSIQIIPNGGAILTGAGASVQFKAIAVYTHGRHPATTSDITSQVTWSSSLVEVATIDASGMATSVAPGIATITATGKGNMGVVTATTSVTVNAGAPPAPARDLLSVAIVPGLQTITNVGGNAQFVAVGTFSSAPFTQDLSAKAVWKSTVTSVAAISASGLATGVGVGNTTIIASVTNTEGALVTNTGTLTVTSDGISPVIRDLTSITLLPGTQTITAVGGTAQFVAIGNFSSAPLTQDLSTSAVWSSTETGVAIINSAGLSTAVNAGTTTITASVTSPSGALIVTTGTLTVTSGVTPPVTRTLTSISIVPGSQAIANVSGSAQFAAIGNFSSAPLTEDYTATAVWSSTQTSVATINNAGLVTAVGMGSTTIMASVNTPATGLISTTATLTVTTNTTPPLLRDLTSIAIIPNSQTVTNIGNPAQVGGTAQFVAIGSFSNAPLTEDLSAAVTWQSTVSSVATVGTTGLVTGVGPGTSTITASATNTSGALITNTATVTVGATSASGLVSLAIVPGSQSVQLTGEASQFIAIGTYSGAAAATQDISGQVTWTSSDITVATINAQGLATGSGAGTTAITAQMIGAAGAVISSTGTFTESVVTPATPGVATLGVYKVGSGSGAITATYVDPQGNTTQILSCGSSASCSGSVPDSDVVTMTATPNGSFGGWSTNCTPVSGTPTMCTLTMSSNQTVAAIFY